MGSTHRGTIPRTPMSEGWKLNIPACQHQTVSLMVSTHTVGQGTNRGWGSTGWGSRADPCMAQILAVMGYVTARHFPQGVGRPPLGLQNFLIEQILQMDRLRMSPVLPTHPKILGFLSLPFWSSPPVSESIKHQLKSQICYSIHQKII